MFFNRLLVASRLATLVLPAWLSLHTIAQATSAPDPSAPNFAALPQDHLDQPWWAARHAAAVQASKDHPDTQLLMLGDSITNNYEKTNLPDQDFLPTWNEFYAPRKALNLGFSGDTTANLLWRLEHGEVAGLQPKVAVVLIGTNNTGWAKESAHQAEVGIDAVVADIERLLPATHILLLGILPSGISAAKSAQDAAVNHYLASLYSENPRITYLDISSIFLSNGRLNANLFYDPRLPAGPGDALHPDTIGQRRMAEAEVSVPGPRFLASDNSIPATLMPDGVHPSDAGYEFWADALSKAFQTPAN